MAMALVPAVVMSALLLSVTVPPSVRPLPLAPMVTFPVTVPTRPPPPPMLWAIRPWELLPALIKVLPVLLRTTEPPAALLPAARLMAPRLALPVTRPVTPPPPPMLCKMISGLVLPLLWYEAVDVRLTLPPFMLPALLLDPSWALPSTLPTWPPLPPTLCRVMAPEKLPVVTMLALFVTVIAPPVLCAWLLMAPRLASPPNTGPV